MRILLNLQVLIEVSYIFEVCGFTGVHLGWTAIPKTLVYFDVFPAAKKINRIVCTCFNGVSYVHVPAA